MDRYSVTGLPIVVRIVLPFGVLKQGLEVCRFLDSLIIDTGGVTTSKNDSEAQHIQ